jgi:predicted amidohydrolase
LTEFRNKDRPYLKVMSPQTQRSVKVAAIQAAPVAFDLTASLEKVAVLTAEAASNGAELVVFPEAFLSAYPWRYAFDATVGYREPRGTFASISCSRVNPQNSLINLRA